MNLRYTHDEAGSGVPGLARREICLVVSLGVLRRKKEYLRHAHDEAGIRGTQEEKARDERGPLIPREIGDHSDRVCV